jgi:hypothetical protein
MTLKVSLEESRMSHESLPVDEVAWCARWMVGSFKQEDIDRVLMRPTQGFEPLVSVVLIALGPFASQFSRLSLSRSPCRICRWSRSHNHRFWRIGLLERQDASRWPRRRERRTSRRSVRSGRPSSARRSISIAASRVSRVSLSRNPPPRWSQGRMRTAATMTPGRDMIP